MAFSILSVGYVQQAHSSIRGRNFEIDTSQLNKTRRDCPR
jgi:hypothetical protein